MICGHVPINQLRANDLQRPLLCNSLAHAGDRSRSSTVLRPAQQRSLLLAAHRHAAGIDQLTGQGAIAVIAWCCPSCDRINYSRRSAAERDRRQPVCCSRSVANLELLHLAVSVSSKASLKAALRP